VVCTWRAPLPRPLRWFPQPRAAGQRDRGRSRGYDREHGERGPCLFW